MLVTLVSTAPVSTLPPSLPLFLQDSLHSLMTTLGQANPYFVRCIKPNGEKVGNSFVPQMVLNQLKYSGMMETVRIRRSGYPVRRLYADFMFRYSVLGRNIPVSEEKAKCGAIMRLYDSSCKDWQLGKTKVCWCTCMCVFSTYTNNTIAAFSSSPPLQMFPAVSLSLSLRSSIAKAWSVFWSGREIRH